MADAPVFPDDEEESPFEEEEEDDDDDDDDDMLGPPEDDYEDLNSASPSTSSPGLPTAAVTTPAPHPSSTAPVSVSATPVLNGNPLTIPITPIAVDSTFQDSKRRLDVLTIHQEERKPLDDSRRLFQRLWTDEDEIELLQGFLDYTAQRGSLHHHDTALFYDQIKSKLQLDFNKNQLVEKLRRLKKKYRTVVSKMSSGKEFSFKSPHDQATFEISRKIWSSTVPIGVEGNALEDFESNPNPNSNFNLIKNEEIVGNCSEKKTPPKSRKRSRPQSGLGTVEKLVFNDGSASNKTSNVSTNIIPGLIEETVRSCLSPLFKELLSNAMGVSCLGTGVAGVTLNPMPLSFGGMRSTSAANGDALDEKWRKQQILELEVYSKRLELVQDQIKIALKELQSARGS